MAGICSRRCTTPNGGRGLLSCTSSWHSCAPDGSTVTGHSVALHRGRRTHVWQTEARNAEGKLCAVVTQTQLVMDAA